MVLDPIKFCSKIRFYPNPEQLQLLEKCLGASRFFYNKSVKILNEKGVKGLLSRGSSVDIGTDNNNDASGQEGGKIRLVGTFGDTGYENCVIVSRLYDNIGQKSELVLFKGNDEASDHIRLRAGSLAFDTLINTLNK